MVHTGKLVPTLLSVLLLTSLLVMPALATTPRTGFPLPAGRAVSEAGPRLLSSTSEGVTFEISVPWEQVSLEPGSAGGNQYVRVSLPGWSETAQAGSPALPMLTEQIGAPFGVNLTVQVLPGKMHTQKLPAPVIPVETQKVKLGLPTANHGAQGLPTSSFVNAEDPAVYAAGEGYPGQLAQVASDGVLRQQRVVGIAIHPVQYHPKTMELTVYESLQVKITFEGSISTLGPAPALESDAYESLLGQELLNYATARQWRQPPGISSARLETGMAGSSLPWTPPNPGWRVKVQADGFYKLTYADLDTAGLPVASLNPHTFRLYNLGSEVAIYVEGESDGKFDSTDFILFHGQAIASKYTADNVYWLTYGGAQGLRMGTRAGAPGTAVTPAFYPAKRHAEENGYYISLAAGDEDLDRWVWDYVFAPDRPSWTHPFTLPAPYTAGTATLTVSMLGYLEDPTYPDHHASISLNNTQVGDVWWDGLDWKTLEMPIPAGLLVAGENILKVTAVNDTGLTYDVFYIDWAELDFSNTFLAENNELAFTYATPGTWKYVVGGFTSSLVDVYDVSNPAAPVRITGIGSTGSGPYAAAFQDTLTTTNNYWAGTSAAYHTVQAGEIKIEKDTASSLQSTSDYVDHIVITHHDFLAAATALSTFRASQGLHAMVVDVQDVYDEFGYGIVGAAPIHAFLAYAYASWPAPAPSYVVLVGDGSYDPKNYLGIGRVNYVPPYLAPVDPWITETAADNRYVTLVGADTLPDMMLGRLSVNSPAEASILVNKIIAYEQTPLPGDWQKQLLVIADNADSAGDFAKFTDDLLSCCLPAPFTAQKVYLGVTHTDTASARAAIQAGINAGKLIVNYVGHAYYTGWASENLFQTADVPLLTNGAMLPVILSMSCRDGYYIAPDLYSADNEALAEVETRADGRGSVASWSPTGLGVSSGHDYLDRGFFNALFRDGKATVGLATAAGKLNLFSTGGNLDLLDTFLLFGDPALRLPLPGIPPTSTPTVTFTPSKSSTFTPSKTPTRTNTTTATFTPSNTPSRTPTRTNTATATFTPSNTQTNTPTATPSRTPTRTSTATATSTPILPYDLPLISGWNLVSFNLRPADTAPASVLSGIAGNYDLVYAWNAGSSSWLKYDPAMPANLNSLKILDEKLGFWIRVNGAQTLTVSGTAPGTSSIAVSTGWNLVGYPSTTNLDLPGAFSGHGLGDFSLAYAYHASDTADPWKKFDPLMPINLNDLKVLAPGWGYWVDVNTAATWNVTY